MKGGKLLTPKKHPNSEKSKEQLLGELLKHFKELEDFNDHLDLPRALTRLLLPIINKDNGFKSLKEHKLWAVVVTELYLNMLLILPTKDSAAAASFVNQASSTGRVERMITLIWLTRELNTQMLRRMGEDPGSWLARYAERWTLKMSRKIQSIIFSYANELDKVDLALCQSVASHSKKSVGS